MTWRALSLAVVAALLMAAPARAQSEGSSVQITPFAGYAFGGSVRDTEFEEDRGFEASLAYGGALNFRVGQTWRFELLYSRQPTKLEGGLGPPFDVTLERYLAGIQEEKGEGSVRWFGTFYLGATRLIPGRSGFDSQTKFTGGVGLGLKSFFTPAIGLRLEIKGFYTVVEAEGGTFCANGNCLFAFSGSGLWQGDLSGGLVIAF
jgi:opacity protein-like surface antigen